MWALAKTAPHQLQAKTQYEEVESDSVTTFRQGELTETVGVQVDGVY